MSIDEVRDYIIKRLREGTTQLYGEGGLAGEVAKRFGLKLSTAGYRVWETVRQLGRDRVAQGEEFRITSFIEEEEVKQFREREEELAGGGFTLEEELKRQIIQNITLLERGLRLKAKEYRTEAGIIDLLAEDSNGETVVIELKAGLAEEKALVQLLRYMGFIKKSDKSKKVRGMLLAHDFSEEVKIAASMIPNVKLKVYNIKFEVADVLQP